MTDFAALGLSNSLTKTLAKNAYKQPTPIQEKIIPLMLQGRDVVGIAQTGTGKTAAFVLPILQQLIGNQHKVKANHCSVLIIVPTRELAAQIDDNIHKYGAHIYHQRACIVGGVKYPKQIAKLNQGLNILVATPGRLEDHLKSGNLSLAHTETIILDEADQMLDLGFFPAIRRIVKQAPRQRQTVLLSATMPKPIRKLADELLDTPIDVAVAPQSKPADKVSQSVILLERPEKRPFVVKAIENQFRSIIFTRTKHGADQLVKYLSKQNIKASAIHGNRSQGQRQRALEAFKSGDEQVLVATDIAARGIDIADVSLVLNYDVPTTPEAYVHRIGRTARAGREGHAITLCSAEEQKYLRAIEKLIKMTLPVENISVSQPDEAAYDPLKENRPRRKKKNSKSSDGGSATHVKEYRGGDKARPAKKRKPKKPKHKAEANSGSAGQRKKGGNKNPPRGPARRRAKRD